MGNHPTQRFFRFCVLLAVCCVLSASVEAAVPHLVCYQGQAVDAQGVPLQGPYTLTFRLYDAETGGTIVWQEVQPDVPLNKGHFSVLLGQVTVLTLDWSQPVWLTTQLGTDPELLPRQRITSVPLAIQAERAETSEVAQQLSSPITTSTIADDANKLVPSGAIILWEDVSCPAGYTQLITYDDKFLMVSSTAGTTGGSDTHTHGGSTGTHALTISEIPAHTHGIRGHWNAGGQGPNFFVNTGDGVGVSTENAGGGAGHSHNISSTDHRPSFKTVVLCKKS